MLSKEIIYEKTHNFVASAFDLTCWPVNDI